MTREDEATSGGARDELAVSLDADDRGWFATAMIDGDPFVLRMPDGYDPAVDQGRVAVQAVVDHLNEREASRTRGAGAS